MLFKLAYLIQARFLADRRPADNSVLVYSDGDDNCQPQTCTQRVMESSFQLKLLL